MPGYDKAAWLELEAAIHCERELVLPVIHAAARLRAAIIGFRGEP
jgi:hypothetical protein